MSGGGLLFSRRATLTVEDIKIDCGQPGQLDISFEVEKDDEKQPNKARISVWNLNPEHRARLSTKAAKDVSGKTQGVRVRLDAGYADTGQARIYEGDLQHVFPEKSITGDVITHIESGDGFAAVQNARINKSWRPGTPVSQVLKDLGSALGVGLGNLPKQVQGATLNGWGQVFPAGTVASGPVVKELDRLTKSSGLSWSIQDGTLQVLGSSQPLDGTAILLKSGSGLIGSPTIDQKDKKGLRISARALMIPDLFPGRKVKIESEQVSGFFKVRKAKYTGDTFALEWYIDLECSALT